MKKNISNLINLTIVFFILIFFINCQTNKEADDLMDEMDQTDPTADTDGDGTPNGSDWCPEEKGLLEFCGCVEIGDDYVWDSYEYEEYPSHSILEVTQAKYDSIQEKVLLKPSHKKGATFQEMQETYIKEEASSRLEVIQPEFEAIVEEVLIDELTNTYTQITKYQFVAPASTKEVAIPQKEETYTIYKLIEDGEGELIDAQYTTLNRRVLAAPASVKEIGFPAIKKVIKIRKIK